MRETLNEGPFVREEYGDMGCKPKKKGKKRPK